MSDESRFMQRRRLGEIVSDRSLSTYTRMPLCVFFVLTWFPHERCVAYIEFPTLAVHFSYSFVHYLLSFLSLFLSLYSILS